MRIVCFTLLEILPKLECLTVTYTFFSVLEYAGDDDDAVEVKPYTPHTLRLQPLVSSIVTIKTVYIRVETLLRGGIVGKPNVYKAPANF